MIVYIIAKTGNSKCQKPYLNCKRERFVLLASLAMPTEQPNKYPFQIKFIHVIRGKRMLKTNYICISPIKTPQTQKKNCQHVETSLETDIDNKFAGLPS